MVTGALASDITVTWLGALGVGLYFRFLWQSRDTEPAARVTLFLIGVLTALLFVRGFFWLWGGPALGRLVFAMATLLPLAVTLFVEQLLRRHHPRWLKWAALGTTVFFGLANLAADLSADAPLLLAFLSAFVLVLLGNGWFMLRASRAELSGNEVRLVRVLMLAAVIATALSVTDFRMQLPQIPARLGALGSLLFICVLLSQELASLARVLVWGPLLAALAAAGLALAFAMASHGIGPGMADAALRGLPVATAWILLTVIVVRIRALAAAHPGNVFLRWLLEARLETPEAFLASLRTLAQTEQHVVLGAADLAGYSVDVLFEAAGGRTEPLGLAEARAWVRQSRPDRLDAAEQLIDLLERHEMTHAVLVSRTRPLIVLLNLPQGANAALGRLRAGVVQRLARRLGNEPAA